MRERLQEFLDHMEMVTSKELSDNEREAVFNDFMKQIQFFQNERLIHLIVTVTFAIISFSKEEYKSFTSTMINLSKTLIIVMMWRKNAV